MLKTKQVHCSYGDALASLSIMIVIHLSYLLPSNYVSVKMPLWAPVPVRTPKKKKGERQIMLRWPLECTTPASSFYSSPVLLSKSTGYMSSSALRSLHSDVSCETTKKSQGKKKKAILTCDCCFVSSLQLCRKPSPVWSVSVSSNDQMRQYQAQRCWPTTYAVLESLANPISVTGPLFWWLTSWSTELMW